MMDWKRVWRITRACSAALAMWIICVFIAIRLFGINPPAVIWWLAGQAAATAGFLTFLWLYKENKEK